MFKYVYISFVTDGFKVTKQDDKAAAFYVNTILVFPSTPASPNTQLGKLSHETQPGSLRGIPLHRAFSALHLSLYTRSTRSKFSTKILNNAEKTGVTAKSQEVMSEKQNSVSNIAFNNISYNNLYLKYVQSYCHKNQKQCYS